MHYPSKYDIDIAVQNISRFNCDPVLNNGQPIKQNGMVIKYTGGFSMVYPIVCPGEKFALRCWYANIGDGKFRYQEIDKYLKQTKLKYFVDFNYVEEGLSINGKKWDTIRMKWVDAHGFKEYLSINIKSPEKIKSLAIDFLAMVAQLHAVNIAHGDLQHGNMLVSKKGEIILVDYDSLYVPGLKGELDLVKGLKGYQHPARFDNNKFVNEKLDYFSELVIFLSLIAISENSSLWNKYMVEDSEQLLFTPYDFSDPLNSEIFDELSLMSAPIKILTKQLQAYCLETNLEGFEPLEKLVSISTGGELNGVSAADKFIEKIGNINFQKMKKKPVDIYKAILDKMFNNNVS